MSKKNRERGKRLEKFVAKDWGGERVGLLGYDDVRIDNWSIECKSMNKYPASITNWMKQAVANCGERYPLVYLHETGAHHLDDLCIMRAMDVKWLLERVNYASP